MVNDMKKLVILLGLLFFTHFSYSDNGFTTGTLKTTKHLITIHYKDDRTEYTVKTHDGTLLESNISEQELVSKLPYLKELIEQGIADKDASVNDQLLQGSNRNDNNYLN